MVVALDGAMLHPQSFANATKSILFIDPTVENYQSLIRGTNPNLKIVILDTYRDGIEQIGESLARNEGLKAVHILSHGGPGCLYLGNSQLSGETLGRYATQLRQWGEALGENADILIYGCKVGADVTFVRELRELTRANIAASATPTGNAALGGDWNLEVTVGEVSSSVAFESATMEAYSGILNRLFAVKDDGSDLIVELDPSTGTEIKSFFIPIEITWQPQGLAFNGNSLFLASSDGFDYTLWELEPDTGAVRDSDSISGLIGLDGLAALDGKIYLLDGNASDIIEFDPLSDTVTNTLDVNVVNADPPNVDVLVSGGLAGITGPNALLAINNNSELVEINPATGEVTDSFLLPGGTGYGVAAIDNEIYVAYNNGSPVVEVFDRAGVSQGTIDNLPNLSALGGDDLLEGILYFSEDSAMDGNGLYALDTATGTSTFLGESGSIGINVGLAPSNDTDSLYGSGPYDLVTVNNDGSGIGFITEEEDPAENLQGLAFDYTREILYGIDGSNFFTLNQNTGNKTALASPPISSLQALAYGNGGVYALGDGQQDLRFYNPNTNAWSVVGDTGEVWPNAGLAFDPFNNVLYAKSSDNTFLYQIDPSNATTTQIGDTGSDKGGGLAFSLFQVPPPQEPNDILSQASYSGLTRSNYGSFDYSGEIDATSDVDLFHFYLGRGDRLAVTPSDLFDGAQQPLGLPEIRIFDASGTAIQEEWSFSPTEDTDYFTAPLSGSYYLGISSTNNDSYDPETENSGSGSNTGTYDLGIESIETAKQRLFAVSSDGSEKIIELDPATGTVVNSFDPPTTLSGSEGLAFDGDRLFFIHDITLYELDPNSGRVIDSDEIFLENQGGLQPSPVLEGLAVLGGKVYILDSGRKDIIEFNPLTSAVTNILDIDGINTDVTLLAGGLAGITKPDALLVTGQLNSTPKVLEINPATGVLTDSFDTNGSGLAVINSEIYVGDSSIEVFNRNGVSQRTINLPGNISALGSDDIPSDKPILYFNRDGRAEGLYSLDPDTGAPTLLGTSDSDGSNVGLAPSSNPELLYGSKPYDSLVEINADGSATNLFSNDFASGLAYDRSQDILYGIDGNNLFSLEPGNPSSSLASSPTAIEGLAFGNNGVYGLGSADQKLWFYDPTTNNWSEIGNTGQYWWQAGLAFDSNKNVLYAKGGQDTFLYKIDVSNAQTTIIGDTGFMEGGGLAFVVPGNTPTEANDTISQASATGLTADNHGVFTYSGEIGDNNNVAPESDVDFFQFQLGVGEEVRLSFPELFDETGMKSGDAVVRLFDSSGNDLSMSNPSVFSDLWEDTPESKVYGSYTTTEAGTFYLGISAENNSFYNANSEGSGSGDADKLGSYNLTVETIDRPMGTGEPNDTLTDAVATGLTLDSPGSYSYTGEIGDNSNILQALDVDLFEFELDIGDTVRFNLPERLDESDNFIASTQVRLFDADGTQIDWEPDGLDYGQFTAQNAGSFYLGISDFDLNAYDPTTIEGRSVFGNSYVEGGTYDLTIETTREENVTLNPGDIAFVQYNADGTDNFKFVALVDIPESEEINFTDNGWKSDNTFRTGEGIITWTAPAGGISAGTVVEIDTTPSASVGIVSEQSDLNFAASGDQILAYQGTDSFIAALNNKGVATWQADSTDTNTSVLPSGLTDGTNAVAINEINNAKYTGVTTGDKTTLLAALNNSANWTGDDSTNQTFSDTFTLTSNSENSMTTTNLYNNTTVTPDDSSAAANGPWLSFNDITAALGKSGAATQNADGTQTILDTTGTGGTNNDIYAGYSNFNTSPALVNPSFPDLDNTQGYTLSFTLQVVSEAKTADDIDYNDDGLDDRAGFSVIAVSQDTTKSIEISFETDEIWAQDITGTSNTSLVRGEGVTFDTTTGLIDYDLKVLANDTYELYANDVLKLSGSLRDYTPINDLAVDPYETSSSIFLGDRADDARAEVNISAISVATADATTTESTPFDFDGDGTGDLLWRHSNGELRVWLMENGDLKTPIVLPDRESAWTVESVANFDSDADSDILWKHTDGRVRLWVMENGDLQTSVQLADRNGWTVEGVADFDGDSDNDILWRNTSGEVRAWVMENGELQTPVTLPDRESGWTVEKVANFDSDSDKDILWKHTDGRVRLWVMENGELQTPVTLPDRNGWTVEGVADFDGDSDNDVLWRDTSGEVRAWVMENGELQTPVTLPDRESGWTVEKVTNFDSDSDNDILWKHTDGRARVWLMENGDLQTPLALPDIDPLLGIENVSDFDGDGDDDILLRYDDGRSRMWRVENGDVQEVFFLPERTSSWQLEQVSNFDSDSDNDVLWRNSSDGRVRLWQLENADFASTNFLADRDSNWELVQSEFLG
ncbi:MAG: DUF4347 domain-containing protein [Cyanobacteriota bacterium]|nr:DUF4347 domain-containing protein [Cyanobacteriota bacterium]